MKRILFLGTALLLTTGATFAAPFAGFTAADTTNPPVAADQPNADITLAQAAAGGTTPFARILSAVTDGTNVSGTGRNNERDDDDENEDDDDHGDDHGDDHDDGDHDGGDHDGGDHDGGDHDGGDSDHD